MRFEIYGDLKMKKDIHPDYHKITYVMTDGTVCETRSCAGKEGEEFRLDVDPKSHPAWQGGTQKIVETGQKDKFDSRFKGFFSE